MGAVLGVNAELRFETGRVGRQFIVYRRTKGSLNLEVVPMV
jgi:hypothetical protein